MPFEIPWTDDPPDVRPRNSLQFWWGLRARWKPNQWVLTMLVEEHEIVVGVQDLIGAEFAVTRQVATGSWLGKAYQGRGIGKENASRHSPPGVRRTWSPARHQRSVRGQRRITCGFASPRVSGEWR